MYLIVVGLIHVVTKYFRGNFTSLDIFQLKQVTIFHNRKIHHAMSLWIMLSDSGYGV